MSQSSEATASSQISVDSDVEVLGVETTIAASAELAEALSHFKPIVIRRGAERFWKVENKTYCAAVISSRLKVIIRSQSMLTRTGSKRIQMEFPK
jgi:hypothetical protein